MLTLADLGVLREVRIGEYGVEVAITPTYTGCPALAMMRADLVHELRAAGFAQVTVRIDLSVPWTTDHISERGKAALRDHGISAPGPVGSPSASSGSVSGSGTVTLSGATCLTLGPVRRVVTCPRCGSERTEVVSEFGATACKALYRCQDCLEPFEHVKEI